MFKSIQYKQYLYIALLIGGAAGSACFFISGLLVEGIVAVLLLLFAVYKLNTHIKKYNRNIIFLLNALENGDYGFHFSETKLSTRERELNKMLNRIKSILVKARTEVMENEKFLSLIINSVSTGIVVLDPSGRVKTVNQSANRILGLSVFTHVNQLSLLDASYPDLFRRLTPGETCRISVATEKDTVQLLIGVSEIVLTKGPARIVTLSNIGSELEAKEMESWIKLIRVMTHEIMNSIAPVNSISEAMLSEINSDSNNGGLSSELVTEAFRTINTTARGLMNFVESYRRFTGVPRPQFERIDIAETLRDLLALSQTKIKELGINICLKEIKCPEVDADPGQITQVFNNLLKNAIEVLIDVEKPQIFIDIEDADGWLRLTLRNNGPEIPKDIVPNIFVPFFTTKEEGTGIGLSLSRYIMRLHGGNLTYSRINCMTAFTMSFPKPSI